MEYYYLDNKDIINDKLTIKYIEKEKITNMSYMFNDCKNLISISNVSKWDISEVTNISYLFSYCESLKYLPNILSYWDTSKVTNMENIFSNCLSLNSIPDISEWNTSKVIKMNNIFFNCNSLKIIPNTTNWNLSNINFMKDYNEEIISLGNDKELLINNYLGKYNFNLKIDCISIIKGFEYGLGILCKITLDKNNSINVLFTSYNVINKKYLSSSNDIVIKANNKVVELPIKERRIWSNSELNYTCIEIDEIDLINDFYFLNENIKDHYHQNMLITIFGLMENKKPFLTNGLITNIKDGSFMYIYNKPTKFLGGAIIINHQKDCIIGIDTEKYNISNKNKKKSIINIGISMKNIIDDINKNSSSLINGKPYKFNFKINL